MLRPLQPSSPRCRRPPRPGPRPPSPGCRACSPRAPLLCALVATPRVSPSFQGRAWRPASRPWPPLSVREHEPLLRPHALTRSRLGLGSLSASHVCGSFLRHMALHSRCRGPRGSFGLPPVACARAILGFLPPSGLTTCSRHMSYCQPCPESAVSRGAAFRGVLGGQPAARGTAAPAACPLLGPSSRQSRKCARTCTGAHVDAEFTRISIAESTPALAAVCSQGPFSGRLVSPLWGREPRSAHSLRQCAHTCTLQSSPCWHC